MPSNVASGAASGASIGTSILPGWGTAIGAVAGGLYGALTKKKAPKTVPFTPVSTIDPQAEQQRALTGNLSTEGDLETLLSRSNRFQQGQASDLLERAVPGYGKLSQSILKRGQQASDNPYDLPQEVTDNLNRIASERGISVGNRGSQMGKFSALKDLGVNMLDYGNQNFSRALQALQTVTGLSPRISPMSPLSFYLNPGQQLATAGTNAGINQFNSSGGQNTVQAGNNANIAAANWNSQNMWGSVLSMAMGGMGGNGATKPGTKPTATAAPATGFFGGE